MKTRITIYLDCGKVVSMEKECDQQEVLDSFQAALDKFYLGYRKPTRTSLLFTGNQRTIIPIAKVSMFIVEQID